MLKPKWIMVGTVALLLAAILIALLMSRDVGGETGTVALELCQDDLSQEIELRKGLLARKDEEIERLKKQIEDREAFWLDAFERKEAEKAGAWCWTNYKDCEYLLERSDKDCLFNMRMAKLVTNEGNMKQLKYRLKANGLSPDAWCNASPEEVAKLKDLTGLDASTGVPVINLRMTYPAPSDLSEAEQIKEDE